MPGEHHEGLTEADYDKIDAVRSSHVRMLLRQPPKHLFHEIEHGSRDTAYQTMGVAGHLALLEPGRFADEVVCSPFADYRSNKAKAWRDEQIAAARIPVKKAEYQELQALAATVANHPLARELLQARPGINELTLVWDDPAGVRCKCRVDRMTTVDTLGVGTTYRRTTCITDVKTMAMPATDIQCLRFAENYGWAVQEAFYRRGFDQVFGSEPRVFYYVVIERAAPHGIRVWEIDEESLMRAQAFVEEKLALIQHCRATGVWPDWPSEVGTLRLRRWAFPEDDDNE